MNRYDDLASTLKLFSAPSATEPSPFGEVIDKLDNKAYTFTATLAVLSFLQPIPLGFFALMAVLLVLL